MRSNPKGAHRERWYHEAGCRRWFNIERDTLTHEILRIYRIGEAAEDKKRAKAKGKGA